MSGMWKELLPGIQHDITLTHIATRLPWTTLTVLSSISRRWQLTIQSREIYRERIRSHSTETLVVIKHYDVQLDNVHNSISLYSMREKKFYRLPPIPQLESGVSPYSQFISVDGKLYVFGVPCRYQLYQFDIRGHIYFENYDKWTESLEPEHMPVYMLDLAGQRQWEECTTVQEPEREYRVSIGGGFKRADLNFVQGGTTDWFRSFWQVSNSGPTKWEEEKQHLRGAEPAHTPYEGPETFVTVQGIKYSLEDAERFTVQGKHYEIRGPYRGKKHHIHAFDRETESWRLQHSISWSTETELKITAAYGPSRWPLILEVVLILPVNNELLALVRWKRHRDDICQHAYRDFGCWHYDTACCLFQSKGFGTDSKEIVWEKPPHDPCQFSVHGRFNCICPIQL